jgi:signal transduction histidine kinase
MKISTRLLIAYISITVVAGIGGYIGFASTNTIVDSLQRINDETLPEIESLKGIKVSSLAVYSETISYLDNTLSSEITLADLQRVEIQFTQEFERYNDVHMRHQDSRDYREPISGAWSKLLYLSDKLVSLKQSKADPEAISLERQHFQQTQLELTSLIDEALDKAIQDSKDKEAQAKATTQLYLTLSIMASILSVAFAVIVGIVLSHKISGQLGRLKEGAAEIAKGNYNINLRATFSDDEIGDLARQFDKMRQDLQAKERLQDEFLSIASHELKNPIQPILNLSHLANQGALEYKLAIEGILANAKRLQKVAQNILDASRIKAGTFTYDMAPVQINRLLQDVVKAVRPSLKGNVAIEMNLDPECPIILADGDKLFQVFANLLDNSIKFTMNGVIGVRTMYLAEKKEVNIAINDSGGGIPEEILPRLFQKFSTQSTIGFENKQGTGLGLFIVKSIISAHGGDITGYNIKGGATFEIELPLTISDKVEDRAQDAEARRL